MDLTAGDWQSWHMKLCLSVSSATPDLCGGDLFLCQHPLRVSAPLGWFDLAVLTCISMQAQQVLTVVVLHQDLCGVVLALQMGLL